MEYKGYTEYQFVDDQSAANFYEEGILPDDFPSLYANEYVFLSAPNGWGKSLPGTRNSKSH